MDAPLYLFSVRTVRSTNDSIGLTKQLTAHPFHSTGTQTMEWFVERGFEEVGVDELPPSRRAMYNHKRASKIYMKRIESSRDLDASELWWNR